MLLRKVDKYREWKHIGSGEMVKEDTLSASELRLKHGLEKDVNIVMAIEAAKRREQQFLRTCSCKDVSLDFSFKKEEEHLASFDDEEGFEADLDGTPRSFVFKHHSVLDLEEKKEDAEENLINVKADKT